MNIKLDENIPYTLRSDLSELGHPADHVHDEGLSGEPDGEIWKAAQEERRFFITQDLDFSDIRRFPPGEHSGLMIIRLQQPGRNALRNRLLQVFRSEATDDWTGKFVVLTDLKLRILDDIPDEPSD